MQADLQLASNSHWNCKQKAVLPAVMFLLSQIEEAMSQLALHLSKQYEQTSAAAGEMKLIIGDVDKMNKCVNQLSFMI